MLPASLSDPRLNTLLERLRNATFTRGARVVAFTAPHADAGTSLLAAMFAQRLHEAGLRVLLLDASLAVDPRASGGNWAPGDGSARDMVAPGLEEPDRLWIAVHPDDAGRFNDPARLRRMFEEDLAHFDAIIVDCAPCEVGSGAAVEAMTIAAIAGATVLVGKANRTLGHERDGAMLLLRECRAQMAGIIINDVIAPRLGAEFARKARIFQRYVPRLVQRFSRWAEDLPLLDLPA